MTTFVCRLDPSGQVDARGHVELAEHVAQVRLDGLEAQEQLVGDLLIRAAVDDEPGDLELTTGE